MPNEANPSLGAAKPFMAITEPLHVELFTWQNVIDESDSLAQQLFLIPDERSQGRPIYSWVHSCNIIFTGHFRPPGAAYALVEEDYPECYIARPVVSVHPKLIAAEEIHGGPVKSICVNFPWTLKDMLLWDSGKRQEALLTQPPQKEIRIQVGDDDPQDVIFGGFLKQPNHKYLSIVDDEGARLGKVVEALRAMVYLHRSKKGGKKKCPKSKDIRTRFSLQRYRTLSFNIENAVLPAGYWVEQALEYEALPEDLREDT